jgi:hypothetical protein
MNSLIGTYAMTDLFYSLPIIVIVGMFTIIYNALKG